MESKNIQQVIFFAVIACLALAYQIQAYTAIFPPSRHPANPNACFDEQLRVFYKMNSESDRPGQCERIFCFKDYSMMLHGCGSVGAGPGCEVVPGDLNKPYPFCCETVKCEPIYDDEGIYENVL